jgi:hypothetical protein
VAVTDQFESESITAVRPTRLCNPADKNGSGIMDPTAHLMCYDVDEQGFTRRDVVVRNQFGDQRLTLLRPELLCNPATKDMVPSALLLDHFKCYDARPTFGAPRFEPRPVTLIDQFETRTATVVKPELFCTPTDKDGSGIRFPACHVTCYRVMPGPPAFTPRPVIVEDQFARQDLRSLRGTCRQADLLCVPSEKNPATP